MTGKIGDNIGLKIFTGETSVVDFIASFRRLKTIAEWNDATAAAHLRFYLGKIALVRYNNLKADEQNDFEASISALKKMFSNVATKLLYLAKLSQNKQGECESMSDYYCRVMNLASIAYESIDTSAREPLILCNFIQGVVSRYRKQLMIAAPKSLDDAFIIASRMETNENVMREQIQTCQICYKHGHVASNCYHYQNTSFNSEKLINYQKHFVGPPNDFPNSYSQAEIRKCESHTPEVTIPIKNMEEQHLKSVHEVGLLLHQPDDIKIEQPTICIAIVSETLRTVISTKPYEGALTSKNENELNEKHKTNITKFTYNDESARKYILQNRDTFYGFTLSRRAFWSILVYFATVSLYPNTCNAIIAYIFKPLRVVQLFDFAKYTTKSFIKCKVRYKEILRHCGMHSYTSLFDKFDYYFVSRVF